MRPRSRRLPFLTAMAVVVTSLAFPQSHPRDFDLPVPLFGADSAWNQTAAGASVLPQSGQQILVAYRVLRGDTTELHPAGPAPTTWPFADVNYDDYSIPICRLGSSQQTVRIRDYEGNPSATNPKLPMSNGSVTVPAPSGAVRPANPAGIDSDGHLVLYDPYSYTAYDYWQATTVTGAGGGQSGTSILEAGMIDVFDVRGDGVNPQGYWSARAVGTPLLAGLIVPEDVERGAIEHALAFALPGLRNTSADPSEPLSSDSVYPAATTETDYYNTNPLALAAGQRIRLKASLVDEAGTTIDEDELAPITRMFLSALRGYGTYLVDNAGGFTFYAEDIHTAVLHLTESEVNQLIGEDDAAALPQDKSKWQVVMEKLNEELATIPFAYGPWEEGQDPSTAVTTRANFEVIDNAAVPFVGFAYRPF